MIHTVVVLYLNLLIVHVAVPFDYNKPKWPVPYRYENADVFSMLIPAMKSCDSKKIKRLYKKG